jgi:hypothetical protein
VVPQLKALVCLAASSESEQPAAEKSAPVREKPVEQPA